MPVILSAAVLKAMLKDAATNGIVLEQADLATRGLHARVSPAGRVMFDWLGWRNADKRVLRYRLGEWPTMSLDAARVAALEIRKRVDSEIGGVTGQRGAADEGD